MRFSLSLSLSLYSTLSSKSQFFERKIVTRIPAKGDTYHKVKTFSFSARDEKRQNFSITRVWIFCSLIKHRESFHSAHEEGGGGEDWKIAILAYFVKRNKTK